MTEELRDRLISRVVDRQESAADWERLAELESGDGEVWLELAQALRCEAELRGALSSELERAETVEVAPARRAPISLAAWSGWLTAAACLLGWIFAARQDVAPSPTRVEDAQLVSIQEPEASPAEPEVVSESSADVITELPVLIVDTQPAESGDGYEVVYLRRVLETRRVDEVLELRPDDTGQMLPVPVDEARMQRPKIL